MTMSSPEIVPGETLPAGMLADAMGLSDVSSMSDRELLEEIVLNMRTVNAALAAFQQIGPAKMMASLFSSRK